ncbi:unnamed protein product, partial [Cyprideis torosa]
MNLIDFRQQLQFLHPCSCSNYILELDKSSGLGDLGIIKWDMALCLLAVYIICFLSLRKGIKTSGKVVWFTALFPYVVLFALLIKGITLEGSMDGIKYYLRPDFSKILSPPVSVLVSFYVSLYLRELISHFKGYRDALITASINSLTSFASGFVIFTVLGYLSHTTKKPIEEVAIGGPGLVFVVYPEAIATMPGSTFFSLLFFMMLLTLGLDSSFGGSEAIITALSDEFKIIGRHRQIFVASLFTFYFLVGLASVSQVRRNYNDRETRNVKNFSSILNGRLSWIDRFSCDIHEMMGFCPGLYWRICWKYIAPIFLLFIIGFEVFGSEALKHDKYEYPAWANVIGWSISLSSIMAIPTVAIYKLIVTPGTFKQRMQILTTPWNESARSHRKTPEGTHTEDEPLNADEGLDDLDNNDVSEEARMQILTTPWNESARSHRKTPEGTHTEDEPLNADEGLDDLDNNDVSEEA